MTYNQSLFGKSVRVSRPQSLRKDRKRLLRFAPSLVVATLLLLLDFVPLNATMVGIAAAIIAAVIAALDPLAWILYICASQVVADPKGFPLTLAEIGAITWVVTLPFNGCRPVLRQTGKYCLTIAPFLAWYYLACFVARQEFPLPIFLAAVVGWMTYAQLCRSGYHYREYLVPLICGSLFAAVGYWGQFFGLPVISVVYQNAAGTGGELFSRVGSGRGDANDVALNLPLTIIGTIALAVFPEDSAKHHRIRLTIVAIVMCALCLPALGATFSRGGLYALPLGAVGLLLMLAISARSIGDAFRALAIPTTVFLSLFLLLAVTKSVSSVSDILRILDARNADNGRIHGESGLFVGREDVWRTHVEETLHYPFFGITKGETWDFGEYGMQTIGSDDAKTGAAAHNAFLEFGSSAGILGFCLFVYLFFSVPMQLIRRAASLRSVAPLIALVMMVFLGFMSLSAPNWKTYWVLLSIMIYCISINSVNRAPVRARSVVRRVGLFNSRGLRGMQPLLRRPIPHDPFND